MTEIRFYHLTRTPLERALPQLLEKVLASGARAVVMAGSSDRVDALTATLWTYADRSFLPHGSRRDGYAAHQPVWLTTEDENPNGATCLVLTDGATAERIGDYQRCLEIFDGQDEEALAAARARWARYKAAGHALTYWQQTPEGAWTLKA
jgi:DNA polymerase III subunit chi